MSLDLGPDAAAGKRNLDIIYDVGPELKKFAAVDAAGSAAPVPVPIPQTVLEPTTTSVSATPVAQTHPLPTTTAQSEEANKAPVELSSHKPTDDPAVTARAIRLEQNRKAARESRRRKKVMIEELQRSVIFFSRANSTLKQQNEELARVLMEAQTKIKAVNEGKDVECLTFNNPKLTSTNSTEDRTEMPVNAAVPPATSVIAALEPGPAITVEPKAAQVAQTRQEQQAEAQAVATQAMLESQGFPAAAARMAAQSMNGSAMSIPTMQPGATMQAMANFQAACAQAMQAAIQGMQSVPGLNLAQIGQSVPNPGSNIQQAYTDQMTAMAMQQAAAAHQAAAARMGAHHFMLAAPLLAGNAMWAANSAVAAAAAAQAPTAQAPTVNVKATAEGTGNEALQGTLNA